MAFKMFSRNCKSCSERKKKPAMRTYAPETESKDDHPDPGEWRGHVSNRIVSEGFLLYVPLSSPVKF